MNCTNSVKILLIIALIIIVSLMITTVYLYGAKLNDEYSKTPNGKVQSEEKISELEMRELFVKLLSNADIVKQENLVSSVIKELSLSEKHFVNAQNILQVTFTEEELKLIEEMSLIKKSNSRLGTKVKE